MTNYPILYRGKDDLGADLLAVEGDLVNTFAGTFVLGDIATKGMPVVSAEYRPDLDATILRFAKDSINALWTSISVFVSDE